MSNGYDRRTIIFDEQRSVDTSSTIVDVSSTTQIHFSDRRLNVYVASKLHILQLPVIIDVYIYRKSSVITINDKINLSVAFQTKL